METSRRSVATTVWRGLIALQAGLQTIAVMFLQHSTAGKQTSTVNACMCSTNKRRRASIVFLLAVSQERSSLE